MRRCSLAAEAWANAEGYVDQATATIGVLPRSGRWVSGPLQKENQRHPLLHCKRINRFECAPVGAHYRAAVVRDGMLVLEWRLRELRSPSRKTTLGADRRAKVPIAARLHFRCPRAMRPNPTTGRQHDATAELLWRDPDIPAITGNAAGVMEQLGLTLPSPEIACATRIQSALGSLAAQRIANGRMPCWRATGA